MDVAALIIAAVALILTLVVSGFAILLQWLMFKANTEQVARMGEQNAALGERLASALTEIREITAHTRGTLDTTMRDVINAALPKIFASGEAEPTTGEEVTEAPGPAEEAAVKGWQREKLVTQVSKWPETKSLLRLVQSKPEGIDLGDVLDHVFEAVPTEPGKTETAAVVAKAISATRTFTALEALGIIIRQGDTILLNKNIDLDSILAEADQP